jgi:phage terminase Nu1 subunit (DNA packaging protein)
MAKVHGNEKAPETVICGVVPLAQMLGITQQQIKNLVDNGVVIKVGRGKYDAIQSVKNYINGMRDREQLRNKKPEEIKVMVEVQKLEHESVKTRKTQLQVMQMEGTLHRAEDVKAIWNNIIVAAKSRLLAIGVKVSPQITGETDATVIKDAIDREVREALTEIKEYDATVMLGDYTVIADTDDEEEGGADDEESDDE